MRCFKREAAVGRGGRKNCTKPTTINQSLLSQHYEIMTGGFDDKRFTLMMNLQFAKTSNDDSSRSHAAEGQEDA